MSSIMTEIVKFDLMGYRRLVFDDVGVSHHSRELYPVPLPGALHVARVVTNRTIPYGEIHWIGSIRKRQWWGLAVGVPGMSLGLFWMAAYFGDWGPFAVSVGFCLLLGVVPLWVFLSGRRFLAIASASEVICLPMDRKRRQIRCAIDLLRAGCRHTHVAWEL